MASTPSSADNSIVYSPEYTEFIRKLTDFHQQRGTNFDPEPRVGVKHIDLHVLFNIVVARGGYDKISDEKLAWRKLGQELNLGMANLPAQAFTLKTAYYKNLAAFEIKTVHKQEPPPKEILEEQTAKGGHLLSRTVENFKGGRRDTLNNGAQNDDSGDDGTPSRELTASEDVAASGGRSNRGLRQAPPQRVLFQPDTLPARQARNIPPQQGNTPATQQPRGASTYNPPTNPDNMSQVVSNYEPRMPKPRTVYPVVTPGNNPVEFARKMREQRELQEAALSGLNPSRPSERIMLPGTGFDGPNIYIKCLQALKSGIHDQQGYALHHLVKISMERGDKFRFEGFAGLAEALTVKCLDVSHLLYNFNWHINYMPESSHEYGRYVLDGVYGTPNILQLMQGLKCLADDNFTSHWFNSNMLLVNQAALTLRNMVLLEDNAKYVARLFPLRDFLSFALALPELESLVELKHYALDITECVTKYLSMTSNDPLYIMLLKQLEGSDRGAIVTSLRALSRISMVLEEQNSLDDVPQLVLEQILNWSLLQDEDLVSACLDFLYQYTAIPKNLNRLLLHEIFSPLLNHVVRLLMHGAVPVYDTAAPVIALEPRAPQPAEIPVLPNDLYQALLRLSEPDRSSNWLRCVFEEDPDESITQIQIWHAYQNRFVAALPGGFPPLLSAAEFIKNVSATFSDRARAEMQTGPVQRFIIKGIRIRDALVDISGRTYLMCRWKVNGKHCGEFCMGRESLHNHILDAHIGAAKNTADNKSGYINRPGVYKCHWGTCNHFNLDNAELRLTALANHIITHIPRCHADGGDIVLPRKAASSEPSLHRPMYMEGPSDERGDAIGIPLSAALILRNIARNILKTEKAHEHKDDFEDRRRIAALDKKNGDVEMADAGGKHDVLAPLKEEFVDLRQCYFKSVEPQLWEVFTYNRTLKFYICDILQMVRGTELMLANTGGVLA